MKNLFLIMCTLMLVNTINSTNGQNPLLTEWDTPFEVPPFDRIAVTDYLPAIQEGIRQQVEIINTMVNSPDAPTFDNTILALDNSDELLNRVTYLFYGLNSANTSEEMQAVARELSPLLSGHNDDINLNPALFARVKAVYDNLDQLKLNANQKRLVEETYKGFVRGGANLPADKQQRLRELNSQIALLQLTFGQHLLAETNAYQLVITDSADLAGLPDAIIARAAETANAHPETAGKWVFTLHKPSLLPFLQFSENRKHRETLFLAYTNLCNNGNAYDNKAIIEDLVRFRLEKARLLGYNTFADYVLEERMAKTSQNVNALLMEIWEPALKTALREAEEMQTLINEGSQPVELEGWDWLFYAEKIRQKNFDLNEEEIKPYFSLDNVRQGIFYLANRLYGITFTEVKEAPKPHEDASLWACNDADGTLLGVLYLDFHPRASKRGGAWCGSYRPQSCKEGKRIPPVVTIVCNFTSPTATLPALLTPDETATFFHEFGHALHGLFRDVPYTGIAGVPRDFVELPSQIMEHWVFEPQLLQEYARHYRTGEVIPPELVSKLEQSNRYGQGYQTVEYIAASVLDMDYHTLDSIGELTVPVFEQAAMERIGLIRQIPPRYRSTYFQHTMTGGYTAGYYSYIWSEVLDCDAYQAFVETGDIFDRSTASRFRETILSKGGSKEAMELYIDFRGDEPTTEALLKKRGLKE